MMFMDGAVPQKFSRLGARIKFLLVQEAIFFAFHFAGAGGPSCAGNRVNKLGCFSKRVDERGFAGAGWRGNDEENSVTGESITQGFEFVREFSRALPYRQRRVVKCRHRSLWRQECLVRERFPG